MFQLCAETHKAEIAAGQFPGVPQARGPVELADIHDVPDLVADITRGQIAYLAYFGHSWGGTDDALLIGESPTPKSNLCTADTLKRYPNTCAPVADIPQGKFLPGAQVRLFGCRAGFGPASIAAELHAYLNVAVYAYSNTGGSMFTQDPKLGHGERASTTLDRGIKNFKADRPIWLVPFNGTPTFRRFA